MRYTSIFSLILLSLALTGCTSLTQTDPQSNLDDTIILDASPDAVQEPLTNLAGGPSNIHTFFFDSEPTQTVEMYHRAGEATEIYFINSWANALQVSVSALGEGGNIRLSQIIMPDGEMDGPFGTELDYPLTQFGGYQLIFNENMMAGDPWSGDIQITLSLRE